MSNINPQSIDGTYPIAGQDNNSQGFRDNFTNTVNNFTFAAAELTDLQQNAVLKAALGSVGQTSVTNDMNYALLTHPQIKGSVETAALNLTVTTNAFVVNWELGHFQSVDLTAATGDATFTFSNWPAANYFTKLRLQVTVTGGTRTLTFPSGVNINISTIQGYTSGSSVSLGNGVYVFEFSTVNFGANVVIEDVLRNYDAPIDFTNLVVSGYSSIAGNLIAGLSTFAAINNTPIGNATPSTGAFTTENATAGAFTTVNATGNVLATGLSVFGNTRIGSLATPGALHTIIGNVDVSGAGTEYFNIGGNILAVSATFGTATINGNLVTGATHVEPGYQQVKPTANVAVAVSGLVNRVLIHPTGTIISFGANVTLPNVQVDGTLINISSNVTIAQLDVRPGWNGVVAVSPAGNATVTAGSNTRYMYIAADFTWYKIA